MMPELDRELSRDGVPSPSVQVQISKQYNKAIQKPGQY